MANYHVVHSDGATATVDLALPGLRWGAATAAGADALTVSWPWDVTALTAGATPAPSTTTVRASLTSEGRRHLARAPVEGLFVTITRFLLGSGRTYDPSWLVVPASAPDTTTLANEVWWGSVAAGDLVVEAANASTLSLRCRGPGKVLSPAPNELLVYARIGNSSLPVELGLEIPFACARLQPWFAAPASSPVQRFVARVVIPLGQGTSVPDSTVWSGLTVTLTATAADATVVVVSYVRTEAESVSAADAMVKVP